jgi:hypothetical protein
MPTATQERTVRAPAEMMKNVQGSSAGAGSGEFHVYKQSRRREYERLKIMEDKNRAVSHNSLSSLHHSPSSTGHRMSCRGDNADAACRKRSRDSSRPDRLNGMQ